LLSPLDEGGGGPKIVDNVTLGKNIVDNAGLQEAYKFIDNLG